MCLRYVNNVGFSGVLLVLFVFDVAVACAGSCGLLGVMFICCCDLLWGLLLQVDVSGLLLAAGYGLLYV